MEVKGTAFVARRAFLIAAFGEDAWRELFDAWLRENPDFPEEVIPVSVIRVEDFLRFNDAVVNHFYDGDVRAHWRFGEASAEWALSEGPYKSFFQSHNTVDFLRTTPSLWKAYYSEGSFRAEFDPASSLVDAWIEVPVPHVHFELNVMGYLHRALELTGAKVVAHEALRGFSKGDESIHYRFRLA